MSENLNIASSLVHISKELGEMNKELKELKIETRENKFSLQEHMRRTELLENYVETLHKKVDEETIQRTATEAVHKYRRDRFDFWTKMFAVFGTAVSIVFGYLKLKGIM